MAKKYLSSLKDFSAGMNDKDAPNLISDNSLVEAQNAIIGRGFVSKRHGYQTYADTPALASYPKWSDIGWKKWGEL